MRKILVRHVSGFGLAFWVWPEVHTVRLGPEYYIVCCILHQQNLGRDYNVLQYNRLSLIANP